MVNMAMKEVVVAVVLVVNLEASCTINGTINGTIRYNVLLSQTCTSLGFILIPIEPTKISSISI